MRAVALARPSGDAARTDINTVGDDASADMSEESSSLVDMGRAELRLVVSGVPVVLRTQPAENRESDYLAEAVGPSALPQDKQALNADISARLVPSATLSPYRFELLQQWEGTVLEVRGDEFEVILHDLTDPTREDESAVFSVDEVSEEDLPLLTGGAVFRWSLGYKTRKGQKERVSNVSFLRLPAWSLTSVQAVEDAAEQLARDFPVAE